MHVTRTDQKTGWGLNLVIQCVESCEKGCDEHLTGNGEDYRGCQMKTKSGHSCMTWTDPRSAPYLGEVQGPPGERGSSCSALEQFRCSLGYFTYFLVRSRRSRVRIPQAGEVKTRATA